MYKFNQVDGTEMGISYKMVRAKLHDFKPEDQNLIALKYFEKLSYKELGEIYKKSEGAMKVKVHRLMGRLRDSIEKEIKNERS